MTLTELRYIVALAQERHFGRAAAKCFVSQPTLSVAIHKLEEELGVQLFERGKAEITLTDIGEKIVVQAQRAIEEADQVLAIAKKGHNPLHGPFKLGVIPTVGPYLLPKLIPALRKRAPSMPLVIEENMTANLRVLLQQGSLDALIVALPLGGAGLNVKPLYDEPFAVVVPSGHPWQDRPAIEAKDLAGENVLVLHAGHCFRVQVLNACPELSQPDQDLIQGSSIETIRNMVASGLGITVFPCSALTQEHSSNMLRVIPFRHPVPSRRIALVWRKSFPRFQAIEILRESILALKIPCLKMLLS